MTRHIVYRWFPCKPSSLVDVNVSVLLPLEAWLHGNKRLKCFLRCDAQWCSILASKSLPIVLRVKIWYNKKTSVSCKWSYNSSICRFGPWKFHIIWPSGESSASAARQRSFDAWDPKLTSSQQQKRQQKRKRKRKRKQHHHHHHHHHHHQQQQQQQQPAAHPNLCNHWEVWLQSTYVASTLWPWTLCASHDGRTWSCVTGQQLAGVFLG